MKPKVLTVCLLLLAATCCNNSYAGHIIHKQTTVSNTAAAVTALSKDQENYRPAELITTIKNLTRADAFRNYYEPGEGGWAGIASLSCGIAGLFFVLLTIPAIIFGGIGLARNRRFKGMAIAGLILGVLTIVFWVLAISFLVSAL